MSSFQSCFSRDGNIVCFSNIILLIISTFIFFFLCSCLFCVILCVIFRLLLLCFGLLTRPKMPFKVMQQEEIAWAEIGWLNGTSKKNSHGTLQSDAPEESDLWTAWQLFPLMTIKHSISKIEWASNDYIIELSSTSQLNWVPLPVEFDAQGGGVELKIGRSYRRNVVGKTTSGLWAFGPW